MAKSRIHPLKTLPSSVDIKRNIVIENWYRNMELVVSATGLELPPQTIRSLSQRLDLAIDRLETVLQKVTVHLERRSVVRSETISKRGDGFDLACRIQLMLDGNESIELADMDDSLSELLDRITERLGVIVSKRADDRKLAAMLRKSRTANREVSLRANPN